MRQAAGWQGWALAMGALLAHAHGMAQPRPDAGTLQEQQRLLPALPQPGGPRPVLPPVPEARETSPAVRITPTAFRIQGNTVFDEATLAGLLQPLVGQPTDLAGLRAAARRIKVYYQDRGYLLTDVYVPEQALPAGGGAVTLAVVEARVGRVTVRGGEASPSLPAMYALVRKELQPGDPITEDKLDRPVLLLRDLFGHEAVATVEPGGRPGEADIGFEVRPVGRRLDFSVGADNHGTRAAGDYRTFATLDAANLGADGDALAARVQLADITDTRLFRVSYTLPAIRLTRASITATRTEYALGKQFAALGATGHANVLGVSALYPLIRSRSRNLYLSLGLDHKDLEDETLASPATSQKIASVRVALLGNHADPVAADSFTSFALSATAGRLRLDAASRAVDQAPGGLDTVGSFSKLNLELQRTQYLGGNFSLYGALQAQFASRNLASAEKISLGGPTGVRGYPSGDGIGDSGALLTLEGRYQLPVSLANEPLSVSLFYDAGTVRFNQDGSAAGPNRRTVDGAGLGLLAGRAGNYLLNASMAWRLGSPLPPAGEPDRSPRFWLTAQKWF